MIKNTYKKHTYKIHTGNTGNKQFHVKKSYQNFLSIYNVKRMNDETLNQPTVGLGDLYLFTAFHVK